MLLMKYDEEYQKESDLQFLVYTIDLCCFILIHQPVATAKEYDKTTLKLQQQKRGD